MSAVTGEQMKELIEVLREIRDALKPVPWVRQGVSYEGGGWKCATCRAWVPSGWTHNCPGVSPNWMYPNTTGSVR